VSYFSKKLTAIYSSSRPFGQRRSHFLH